MLTKKTIRQAIDKHWQDWDIEDLDESAGTFCLIRDNSEYDESISLTFCPDTNTYIASIETRRTIEGFGPTLDKAVEMAVQGL